MSNSSERERALITGATGFVGSHITERLLSEGWDVHIIVRPNDEYPRVHGFPDRVTQHIYDGSTESMFKIVSNSKPNTVFHLAAYFLSEHRPEDLELLIRSNLLFSTQLVDAMVAHSVYALINTGSSWQHYEDKDYNPVCLYAATKQAFEAILTFYTMSTALKVITLKLFDTYGPNDRRPKLFNLLRKAAKEGTPLLMSPGEQLLDLVYIDDVVEAFVLAAERLGSEMTSQHEYYAVSSGNPLLLREVVELYARISGKSLPVKWGGRPYRGREVMVPWTKGIPLPGWSPKVGIENGIKKINNFTD